MQEQNTENKVASPGWSNNTKLVVALTFVAVLVGVLVKFRNLIGPLLLAFIVSYLVYPLIEKLHHKLRIPWRLAVLIVYLVGVLTLIGLIVWGGIALIDQLQSLIRFLQISIADLPNYINQLSHQVIAIGPFKLDFETIDLRAVASELTKVIQPLFSRVGSFIGSIASSTFSVISWALFLILISFFMVSETGGNADRLIDIQIPGYPYDTQRLGVELSHIWNAFLRNQFLLIVFTVIIYSFLLGILQVRFFFGLALLAGMGRFVPYVGPAIAWTTYGLVAYFQGFTVLGLTPFWYVVLVIGIALIMDVLIDSIVTPILMADTLKVHPAAVLVTVLVAANLMGVVGVLLAAPVLASAKLVGDYGFSKLFDLDPWRGFSTNQTPKRLSFKLDRWRQKTRMLWLELREFLKNKKNRTK
ncbi:MAG: AI-2E family transporter [Anaerolineaceae bacterium]|nr:AI-2E family transporter [Anaerolineaceae bacterium]